MIESRGLYMEINESRLSFVFSEETKAYKFDDDKFYRKEFNNMSGSKGVDIIASSDKFIHMIEVKNCVGDEKNNIWRIVANNKKLSNNNMFEKSFLIFCKSINLFICVINIFRNNNKFIIIVG